jgi:membrane glycosyltransferase
MVGDWPLLLAIPMAVLTSKIGVGAALRARNYLPIPGETRSPAVLRRAWQQARPRASVKLQTV